MQALTEHVLEEKSVCRANKMKFGSVFTVHSQAQGSMPRMRRKRPSYSVRSLFLALSLFCSYLALNQANPSCAIEV